MRLLVTIAKLHQHAELVAEPRNFVGETIERRAWQSASPPAGDSRHLDWASESRRHTLRPSPIGGAPVWPMNDELISTALAHNWA